MLICVLAPALATLVVFWLKRTDYSVRSPAWIAALGSPIRPVRWNLETYQKYNKRLFQIGGWLYEPNGPRWLNTKVLLVRKGAANEGDGIELRTNLQVRHDVTLAADDGGDYDRSGFYALAPADLVSAGFRKVLLVIEINDKRFIIDTAVILDAN